MSVSPQAAIVDAAGPIVGGRPLLLQPMPALPGTWPRSTTARRLCRRRNPLAPARSATPRPRSCGTRQRGLFIAAIRSHGYYSSPDGATWTRLAVQPGTGLTTANCPVGTQRPGQRQLPHLPRNARRAAGNRRPLRSDGRRERQRPGALAGSLQRCRRLLREPVAHLGRAHRQRRAGGRFRQHGHPAGKL